MIICFFYFPLYEYILGDTQTVIVVLICLKRWFNEIHAIVGIQQKCKSRSFF
jgi:hypothetical protein